MKTIQKIMIGMTVLGGTILTAGLTKSIMKGVNKLKTTKENIKDENEKITKETDYIINQNKNIEVEIEDLKKEIKDAKSENENLKEYIKDMSKKYENNEEILTVEIQEIIKDKKESNQTNEDFKIVSFEKIGATPCYESTWKILIKGDKEEIKDKDIKYKDHLIINDIEDYIEVQLTRFDEETEDNMKQLLNECKTLKDVCDLHTNVYYD